MCSSDLIKLVAFKNGFAKSFTEDVTFVRLPYRKTVTYKNPFSHNYTAGGMNGLVDGIKAEPGAFGSWQGFQGVDFEAVVDLGSQRTIASVSTNFLQNYPSWIWLPTEAAVLPSLVTAGWHVAFAGPRSSLLSRQPGPMTTASAGVLARRCFPGP